MENTAVLAFDCATAGASIAVHAKGRTFSHTLPQGKQAAALVSSMDRLLQEAGCTYADLTLIVTTVGPGSFTGLRIGLAALHGLVLVHRTPIKTLTTLEAMAWHIARQAESPTTFTAAIRAGKGELYTQEFTKEGNIPLAQGEICLLPETHTDWQSPCFSNHLPADAALYLPGPSSETLCHIADHLQVTPLAEALPLYIRAPDAVIPTPLAWLS